MELAVKGGISLQETKDVALAKKGNKEAFVRIIRENEKIMYRVAKNYLKSNEDILDAIGETTLKAYEKINTLKDDGYFKTWLIRILINECNYILRKSKNVVLNFEEGLVEDLHIDTYENLDLKDALELLPISMKLILNLHYYEDLSIKDISKVLDINENTVKTNLRRGRDRLYKLLKEESHE